MNIDGKMRASIECLPQTCDMKYDPTFHFILPNDFYLPLDVGSSVTMTCKPGWQQAGGDKDVTCGCTVETERAIVLKDDTSKTAISDDCSPLSSVCAERVPDFCSGAAFPGNSGITTAQIIPAGNSGSR